MTPNLNIIRKSSAPISSNIGNKLIDRINNNKGYLIYECQRSLNNKIKEEKSNEKNILTNNNKILNQEVIKTDTNIKKYSFSCTKNKILKNYVNLQTNSSINEKNLLQKNYINKNYPIKNSIYNSINNFNSKNTNKIPFSYNSNRSLQSKNKSKNNSNYIPKQKTQRKNSSMISKRNANTSLNRSINANKLYRNSSRQNKDELNQNNELKPFKSENKITVVHSKVNDEINNLFSGLSDKIVKDPEIHNKIECLIKDIKDIQQVVHRKTQVHFRPRKQNNIVNQKKNEKDC